MEQNDTSFQDRELLIEQLYLPLFQYIKRRIRHTEDAEDITQEVFFKLSNSRVTEIQDLKNWVYAIAQNAVIDHYRKQKPQVQALSEDPRMPSPSEEPSVNELSKCISSYLELLPPEYRKILRLSEIESIPQKEIAEMLQLNYATVRSKIQRGRRRLRQLFSDCCQVIQGGKGSIMDIIPRNPPNQTDCSCHEY